MSITLKNEIAKMIRTYGSVTFAELEQIPGFKGDICQVLVNKRLNYEILIWPGLSEEASTAMDKLLAEKAITASTCNILAYFSDGRVPEVELLPRSIMSRTKPFAKLKTYWQPLQFNDFSKVSEADRIPLRLSVSGSPAMA